MESGSDDEFFDATENLSFNSRSKSVASGIEGDTNKPVTKKGTDEGSITEVKYGSCIVGSESNRLASGLTTNSAHILGSNNKDDSTCTSKNETVQPSPNTSDLHQSLKADNEKVACSDQASSALAVEKGVCIDSGKRTNKEDKFEEPNNNEDSSIIIPTTTSVENTDTSTIKAKHIPSSPNEPPPVAPPRRKKKGTKKQTIQKELIVEGADISSEDKYSPGHGKDCMDPCIEVKLGTHEMTQVLEKGNSFDVVYNEDSIARKSGSLTGTENLNKLVSSESGCQLTDEEILEQVIIKNLDTGETIPLSMAGDKLPECTNPLTLHILRLATECENDPDTLSTTGADERDEDGHLSDVSTASGGKMQGKRKKLKKFLGKTVQKIKSVADEVSQQVRKGEEEESSEEEQEEGDDGYIKFKNRRSKKDRLMFDHIKLLQDLSGEHIGAVWTMKFSLCGKLLATAGQDNVVRVWVLKDAAFNFEEMRRKYSRPLGRTSPTGSMTSSNSTASAEDELQIELANNADDDNSGEPFRSHPFVRYHGHTSDVLDLSWSKNYFLLSSSMDKTVRLWHISRQECLCCFQHVDFVTAICFHPRDDRYFLSGSLDGKIRLWNIPEKKVALWNEIDGYGTSLVTAANFCQNGKLAVVGTYDGRCIFFDTEKLKYHTQVTVRSSRGKNARGRKISGIEPMPGEDKVLITSNDSRIRLYDLKDHSLFCKYKGLQNESSQIRANFSHDGKLILCGSEDKYVYIWPTHHDVPNVRKDRNEYYESFSAHDAVVTAAIFAPFPTAIIEKPPQEKVTPTLASSSGAKELTPTLASSSGAKELTHKPFEIIVAADWQGGVKLYINR